MNTILIFGCSDRISDWQQGFKNSFNSAGLLSKSGDRVFDELKKYPSIGLNRFPGFFPFVNYWLWIDNKDFGNCVYKRSNKKFRPYLQFETNIDLFGAYTVASFALDFAVKKGFQRAILYGILDGEYKLLKKQGLHPGHWMFSYKYFYCNRERTIPLQKLQQFKHIIYSYKDKIEVEIPYRTI